MKWASHRAVLFGGCARLPSGQVVQCCRWCSETTEQYRACMTLIDIEDLPTATSDVLRRRARAAGLPVRQYVRRELTALAGRRVPIDAVVQFLADERPGHPAAELDAGALALINIYDLPAEAWSVFNARAAAAGMPLSAYVRSELITSARRSTVDDAVLEIREIVDNAPGLELDMKTVIESVRYARGM